MGKYVKVVDGLNSNAGNYRYKLNEVNIANNWNPKSQKGKDFGGFNYADEECILRWLHRGNVIYDVELPKDALVVEVEGATKIYRSNKIIIKNPRKIDDDLALYTALGVVSIMNYRKTAYKILETRVNKNNINDVLEEWNYFINKKNRKNSNELVKEIDKYLNELKL